MRWRGPLCIIPKCFSGFLKCKLIEITDRGWTCLWFLANQYLLFLLNTACLAEKQQIPMLLSLVGPERDSRRAHKPLHHRYGFIKSRISCLRCGTSTYYVPIRGGFRGGVRGVRPSPPPPHPPKIRKTYVIQR